METKRRGGKVRGRGGGRGRERGRRSRNKSERNGQGNREKTFMDVQRCIDGLLRESTSSSRRECLDKLEKFVDETGYFDDMLSNGRNDGGCIGAERVSIIIRNIMSGALGGKAGVISLPGYKSNNNKEDACNLFAKGLELLQKWSNLYGSRFRQFTLAAQYAGRLPGAENALRHLETAHNSVPLRNDDASICDEMNDDVIESILKDVRRCENCLLLYIQLQNVKNSGTACMLQKETHGVNASLLSNNLQCNDSDNDNRDGGKEADIEWENDNEEYRRHYSIGHSEHDGDTHVIESEFDESRTTLYNELFELRRLIVSKYIPRVREFLSKSFPDPNQGVNVQNETRQNLPSSFSPSNSIVLIRKKAQGLQDELLTIDEKCSKHGIDCLSQMYLNSEIEVDLDLDNNYECN